MSERLSIPDAEWRTYPLIGFKDGNAWVRIKHLDDVALAARVRWWLSRNFAYRAKMGQEELDRRQAVQCAS